MEDSIPSSISPQASRSLSFAQVLLSGLLGWVAYLGAYAIWLFLIPHAAKMGPEIGPLASFIVWAVILSLMFVVNFAITALLISRKLKAVPSPEPTGKTCLSYSLIFAGLFAVESLAGGCRSALTLALIALPGIAAGLISLAMLRAQLRR